MEVSKTVFPFVRIVGQEEMKRALLLNIIDPGIGGVLIKGEKGTAKSTTVRSLEQILPVMKSSKGCKFHCDVNSSRGLCEDCRAKFENGKLESEDRRMSVVELPLNVTEDRIAGSLDIEYILRTGEKKYEPGILAQANCNLLYVDEVNLLDDHIVDLLLDSAAMGRNYVEREGISFSHPSKFILVGTMNPEEGSLRPQLLDRFGLSVDIIGEKNLGVRKEVIRRRLEFDANPDAYLESCKDETEALRKRIEDARANVGNIEVSDKVLEYVADISLTYKIEGHRADLAMIRTARANAAFEGHKEITKDDLYFTAPMVLGHRVKINQFEENNGFNKDGLKACLRY